MNTKEISKIYNNLSFMHPQAGCELNYNTPFELLVAVILSAQCTDIRVNQITDKLFKVYNNPIQYAALSAQELKPYIYSCGFYNNKAKNIIAMSKALIKKHNGEVPRTMQELVELDGVGRKTASVVLTVAFGIPAMPVDTHVLRVSKRLGLVKSSTPEGVEKELMNIIEKKNWHDFHHYLIFHGRYICKARNPQCQDCNLTNYCKFYKTYKEQKI